MHRRRRRGSGGIETTRDGRHRVRAPGGRRASLGVYETRDEAEAVLAAALDELADVHHGEGLTLAAWATRVLDQREADGLRGIREERNRWASYVAKDELARLPIRTINRRDVLRWLDGVRAKRASRPGPGGRVTTGRKLGRQTVLNALTLLRTVLEDASQRNVIGDNPARGITLPREQRTRDPWTFLHPDEQRRLVRAAGDDWPMVAFAIGTGLRQGEQWSLELADVHLEEQQPRVVVRFGSPGKPPKNGRIRVVPLLGIAVEAVRAQLEVLAGRRERATKWRRPDPNPRGLLFPGRSGGHRKRGEPKSLVHARDAAKLGRHVRWHDLRHTCASSLVAGWWGRAWSLEEVCDMLGHSSIKVTERYAHLAGTLVDRAAAATRAAVRGLIVSPQPSKTAQPKKRKNSSKKAGSHLRDLNSRPTVYETVGVANDLAPVASLSAHERAYRALAAVAGGDPTAITKLVELAAEVLAAAPVQQRKRPRKLRTA